MAAASPDLAVEADGLRLVDPASGAARALPFGMPQEQLLALLEGFRGPADGGTNPECGAGPVDYAAWADGLTLNFQESRFAGWALDQRAQGSHATMSGIGPGSTRRELEAAYEIEVEQTSLGIEFTAGGIGGILDGDIGARRGLVGGRRLRPVGRRARVGGGVAVAFRGAAGGQEQRRQRGCALRPNHRAAGKPISPPFASNVLFISVVPVSGASSHRSATASSRASP